MTKIKKIKSNKLTLSLILFSFFYLFFFHFIFHQLDRNIYSFPEVEEIIIFFSLIINDGFIESYDHTGYPLFILLSQIFRSLKLIGFLEISSISDLLLFDVYSNAHKNLYLTIRIFSFILNLLTYFLIIKIFDKIFLNSFFKIALIIFILIVPNLNYLFIGSLTSAFGFFLFLLSIFFLLNSDKKFHIFAGTFFLLLAVQTKIQFLPFLFIIPIFFATSELFNKNKNTEFLVNKNKHLLIFSFTSFLLFLSIAFIFILLNQKNILSIFQFFILAFFLSLNLFFYLVKKNKLEVIHRSSQIYLAFFVSVVFLSIKFHPNNFFVIFDPINTNAAYFDTSTDLSILNFSNHLIFLKQKLLIFLTNFINYNNISNIFFGNFYNNFPLSQPFYLFSLIFIFVSLIKRKVNLFFINILSLLFLLILIKINTGVRSWPEHFWYLIYSDIIVIGTFIYNINQLIKNIKIIRSIQIFFVTVVIFNNASFYDRMNKISGSYGFDNKKSTIYYNIQHCDRLPYLNRVQKKYSLLKVNSYYVQEYIDLKNNYVNKHFEMCSSLKG